MGGKEMKEIIEERELSEKELLRLLKEYLEGVDKTEIRFLWYVNELDVCEQLMEIEKENGKFHVKIHDLFC